MNLFELFFKIGVKDEASKEVAALSDKLGKGLKTSAKIGLSAVGAAAAGVAALTKQSLESYAEYEQLVGGVETLFGAGGKTLEEYANSVGKSTSEAAEEYGALMKAQQTVLDNADEAYKSAGLSANEYMSTVTSFSASLLQSLGGDTQAASELADQALIDMSDNANKMGTDMQMIQNAYQGFAKQNYTMLDNLKLGYGGTKTEMRRLIKEAAALDESVDASSMSFDNIVRAIHAVQKEMGITGTTVTEAANTITGSVNMANAAWENLMIALADENGDVEGAADRFIESIDIAADNILPRVKVILKQIPRVIRDVGPDIIRELPGLVDELAPDAAEAVADLVVAAIEVIPSLGVEVIKAIDKILEEVGDSLAEKFPAFGWFFDNLEDKVWAVVAAITAFKTIKGVTDFINTVSKAMDILTMRTQARTVAQTNLNTATANYSNILKKLSNSKIFSWMMGRGASGGATPMGAGGGLPTVYDAGAAGAKMTSFGGTFVNFNSAYEQAKVFTNDYMNKWIRNQYDSYDQIPEEVLKNIEKTGILEDLKSLYGIDGSHRLGLARVPYDGYIAELHEGERVLTKTEAEKYRGEKRGDVTVNVNIDGARYNDVDSLADAVAQRLARLFEDEDAVYA